MREALRAFWAGRSRRERALLAVAGCFISVWLVDAVAVRPFRAYRAGVKAELAIERERLASDRQYLARAADIREEVAAWKARLEELRSHLVPGETDTLGAANLQDKLHALAEETGVTVQSTQVIREQATKGVQPVAVRLSLSGDLGSIAEFLARVEYGPLHVRVPFFEVARRGTFRARRGRGLSATIQVTGFLRGSHPGADKGDEET